MEKGQLKCFPMNEFPEKVQGEHFSKTVLVYDKDLDDVDLGFTILILKNGM